MLGIDTKDHQVGKAYRFLRRETWAGGLKFQIWTGLPVVEKVAPDLI